MGATDSGAIFSHALEEGDDVSLLEMGELEEAREVERSDYLRKPFI